MTTNEKEKVLELSKRIQQIFSDEQIDCLLANLEVFLREKNLGVYDRDTDMFKDQL
jgi:late competence protein required for DNA uptake (superfamily II DNA/RNA helicase)